MAKLVLKFKGMVRKEYSLNNPIVAIGRSATNDIFIDNLAVSRNHAQIVRNGDQYVIEDLNSNNGTFVNGNRIESHELKDGDTIQVGKHSLEFVAKGEAAETVEASSSPDLEDYSSEMEGTILTFGAQKKINAAAAPAAPAAAPKPPAKPQFAGALTVMAGDLSQTRYELTNPATNIGKGDVAEIRLAGFFTPSVAVVIHRRDDGFYVIPVGGFFSPRLNNAKLTGETKLKTGDVLEIRGYKFQYQQR